MSRYSTLSPSPSNEIVEPIQGIINTRYENLRYSPLSPPPSAGMLATPDVQRIINNLESADQNQDVYSNFMNKRKKIASGIRMTSYGAKVIRIEIYDADQFENFEKSMCQCNAEICAQHVVQNVFSDNIYARVKDLLKNIDTSYLSM